MRAAVERFDWFLVAVMVVLAAALIAIFVLLVSAASALPEPQPRCTDSGVIAIAGGGISAAECSFP